MGIVNCREKDVVDSVIGYTLIIHYATVVVFVFFWWLPPLFYFMQAMGILLDLIVGQTINCAV